MKRTILNGFAMLLLAACAGSGDVPYDENWGAEELVATGKADSLFDIAQDLKFGQEVTGNVGSERIEVFTLELRQTDRVLIEMTVTSGDLNPHLSLFYGAHQYISSEAWEREGASLRKWYIADATGKYLVAVRAYQHQGTGDYLLKISCQDGPCNGDFPPPSEAGMDLGDTAQCIADARRCAFERMAQYNGAVGDARAEKLLSDCLAEQSTDDGLSCSQACQPAHADQDDNNDITELCQSIRQGLIFYADQSDACLQLFDDCMAECHRLGSSYSGNADSFYMTTESMCWINGFNGTCDSFARGHTACGGDAYGPDTLGECYNRCESTAGVFMDDLDTVCDEACDMDFGPYCDEIRDACRSQCGGGTDVDFVCYSNCIEDKDEYCH